LGFLENELGDQERRENFIKRTFSEKRSGNAGRKVPAREQNFETQQWGTVMRVTIRRDRQYQVKPLCEKFKRPAIKYVERGPTPKLAILKSTIDESQTRKPQVWCLFGC